MSDTLLAKLFVTGKLEAKTGLHIGGSSTALDIGGIDLNVIKTPHGMPFIPGSSLKGKIRCLLEVKNGFDQLCKDVNHPSGIPFIFGKSSDRETGDGVRTRLIVRDAFLDKGHFDKEFEGRELELIYSETKWENFIDRASSKAEHPRQLERVPAGARFGVEMVYNLLAEDDVKRFATIIEGMRLLEDDYLGGSGSRGYGKVKFQEMKFEIKKAEQYRGENQRVVLPGFESANLSLDVPALIKAIQHHLGNNHAGH